MSGIIKHMTKKTALPPLAFGKDIAIVHEI
jgi:hypothetical protein